MTRSEEFPQDLVKLKFKSRNNRDYNASLIKYIEDKEITTYVVTKNSDLVSRVMAISPEQRIEVLKELMIKEDRVITFSSTDEWGSLFNEMSGYNGSIIIRGDQPEWSHSSGLGKCQRVFRAGGLYSELPSTEEHRISYRGADFNKVAYNGFEGFQDEFGNIWGDLVQREGSAMALSHELAKKYCEQIKAELPSRIQIEELFSQLGDIKVEDISFRKLQGQDIELRTSDDSIENIPGLELERAVNLPIFMDNGQYEWSSGFKASKVYQSSLGHFRCVKKINQI